MRNVMRTVLVALVVVAGVGLAGSPASAAPYPPKQMVMRVAPGSPVYSQITKLSVTIKRTPVGAPRGGTVTFFVDDVAVGSVSNVRHFVSFLNTTALTPGTHTVRTEYGGDATTAPGTSNVVTVTVTRANTATSLSSAVNPVHSGDPAEIRAVVRSVAPATTGRRPAGSVTFVAGARRATVAVNANGVAVWRPVLAEGSYTVEATYTGSELHAPAPVATTDLEVTTPV
ncbi:MAG TPA: Ig-like domain-containing protein [Iamia sp.]|nr:Ig-like domain-containing protein [Iamia sp.]